MNGVICHSWQPPDAFFTALTVLDAIVAHPLFVFLGTTIRRKDLKI